MMLASLLLAVGIGLLVTELGVVWAAIRALLRLLYHLPTPPAVRLWPHQAMVLALARRLAQVGVVSAPRA